MLMLALAVMLAAPHQHSDPSQKPNNIQIVRQSFQVIASLLPTSLDDYPRFLELYEAFYCGVGEF
jgi:hypothetical protein